MESKEERKKRQQREAVRRWRERHPELARENQRRWYEENKEEIWVKARENMRTEYATDPQRIRASNKAWYEWNRESRREYARQRRLAKLEEFRAKDRARSRARYAADPVEGLPHRSTSRNGDDETSRSRMRACVRAATIKRRRAAGGQSFSAAEWLALLAYHGGACAYCGSKILIEIDHRTPLALGGSNLI